MEKNMICNKEDAINFLQDLSSDTIMIIVSHSRLNADIDNSTLEELVKDGSLVETEKGWYQYNRTV